MKMKILNFVIAICSLIRANDGANILMLNGAPSPSHFIFNKAVIEGLAKRGHNLTVVSPDVEKNPPANITYIALENVYSHLYNGTEHISLLEMSKDTTLQYISSYIDFTVSACEGIALSKGLNVIKNYPKDFKFDLVLNDFTCGECLLGLLPHFNYPPLVGITAFNNPSFTADIVGGDKLGLTSKPFCALSYDSDMNIFQRLHNGFIKFYDSMMRKYYATPAIDKIMKQIYGPQTPYAGDLDKRSVLMLVNSHPGLDYPESIPPNIVPVAGLQIKAPKQLPEDMESFIKKGKKGAVLMALGTNMRSDQLGEKVIDMIIEAFREFPDYNFLWKFETSEMMMNKNLPKNLKISAWVPQNDILAHPNVKLFISHGGLLSTQETTWHGVPIVGIPFFSDQHNNMFNSVGAGVGVKVDVHTMTTKVLADAIQEVLNNPKYRENMEIRSKRFRDQPELPLDRAIWNIEYIIRNPNASHLRPSEFNFGLLGSHFWDIQLIIVLFILFTVWMMKKIIKKIFKGKSQTSKVSKKKNN